MNKIYSNDIYFVKYPFVKVKISLFDGEDGFNELVSWRPGTLPRMIYPDDSEEFAHAEGKMKLSVVDTFKPGKYPERIFYTRKFIDPDGKEFGKNNLHICSIQKFRRISTSFYYDYVIDPDEEL